jgi:tetratricopeptide (TPR) repeat protein
VRTDLHEIGREFESWLNGADATVQPIVTDFLELKVSQWIQLGESFPALVTLETVRKIIDRAHWLIQREPQDAVTIARLAVRVAQNIPIRDVNGSEADALIETEANAWREEASALLNVEDYLEAENAAIQAHRLYSILPPGSSNAAILGLIAGQIVHALDASSNKGLVMVEQSSNLLLSQYGMKKKYVEGRIIHAKMLIDRQQYDDAIESYQGAADVAEELNDKELLAHILNNVGVCHSRKGDLTEARPCLETARELFERLGLKADAIRPRSAWVRALVANGRYNDAISEYYTIRAAYLSLRLHVTAARVALKIVDLLFLANRLSDVPALCSEMIGTFQRVGLPREARQALAHLNAAAQTRGATAEDVEHARAVLDRVADVEADDLEAGA